MAQAAVELYKRLSAAGGSSKTNAAAAADPGEHPGCIVFRIAKTAAAAPMSAQAKHSLVQSVLNRLSVDNVKQCVDKIMTNLPLREHADGTALVQTLLQPAVVQSTGASALAALIRQLAGCKRPTFDGTLLARAINLHVVTAHPMSGEDGGKLFVQLCSARVRLLTSETVASVLGGQLTSVDDPQCVLFAIGCASEALACHNSASTLQPLHEFIVAVRKSKVERQGAYMRVHALQDNLLGA
jgi:hypothetical protein